VSHLTAGIALASLSVTSNATGMVLEKYATRRLPSIHARQGFRMISVLARDPLWVIGFVCLMFGLGTQVLALTLAPIDIVQPIAACGIALFLVMSHFVLRERLSTFEYFGISAILLSLLLLGFSVNSQDDLVTGSTSAIRVFSVALPALIAALVIFALTDRIHVSSVRSAHIKAPLFGISSGLLYGVAGLGVKEVSTTVRQYGLIDAVPRILASPGFYLLLGSTALGFLVFQTALQRTTASVFVPVNTVTSSCYFIIAGTLLFHERLPTAAGPLVLRLGAFLLILFGVLILAASRSLVGAGAKPQGVNGSSPHTPLVADAPLLVADAATIADCDQRKAAASESVQLMLREFSSAEMSGSVAGHSAMGDLFVPWWRPSEISPVRDLTSPFLVRDRLTHAQLLRRRHGGEVVVCRITLDTLKKIELELGRVAAEKVLRETSRRLLSMVRTEDTVGRLGESKLVVVLTVDDEQHVGPLLRRLQHGLDEPILLEGAVVRLETSLGVALADESESATDVLARADRSTRVGRRLRPGPSTVSVSRTPSARAESPMPSPRHSTEEPVREPVPASVRG
jgi:diguanylate cyclase (GGDEF)-like protein